MSALATEAAPVVVASYARRSKRAAGDGKGAHINIADQHEQNRSYAAHEFPGATVVEYDDNMSAWDPERTRPGWERMLKDARAGRLSAVVGRYADRLTRQPEQGEALLSACKKSRAELHTTSGGHITSALAFRIELAIAAEESDQKSRRMTDKHRTIAAAGGFHGGRRRFGYEPNMTDLRDVEAVAIREAAARVLAGASLYSVAQWLNDGLTPDQLGPTRMPTAEGNRWTGSNVGVMLRRPHLAGIRVHQGKPAGLGAWPAVLDVATHELIVDKLTDPERRTSYTNARRYLLAGLATCAECGKPLRGRPGTKANPERRAYATGRHCYRATEVVDAAVSERIVHRLETLTEAGKLRLQRDESADELAELSRAKLAAVGRRKALADRWAAGEIDDDDHDTRLAAITGHIATTEARMVELRREATTPVAVLDGMTGPGARAAWEAADLGRRRAIIDTLAEVRLHGAATKRAPFRMSDVDVVWKIG
jgi:DNA invertase Pin-like site-specific DNA recombinase